MPERVSGYFKAVADDGTVYTVTVIQEYTEQRNVDGSVVRSDGMKRMELANGSTVIIEDEDLETFKIPY